MLQKRERQVNCVLHNRGEIRKLAITVSSWKDEKTPIIIDRQFDVFRKTKINAVVISKLYNQLAHLS